MDSPRSSMSRARTSVVFREPSLDDDEAPLLIRNEVDKPAFKTTFSFVNLLRFLTIPVSITDCAFLTKTHELPGLTGFLTFLVVCGLVWNIFQILSSFGRPGQKRKWELQIGSFMCSYGRVGDQDPALQRRRSYLVNLVDFVFCGLFIIPSVLPFKLWIWTWGTYEAVGGLSITLASLHLAISFLGLFSVFRKVKVCVYAAEEDEKVAYRIPESYHDASPQPAEFPTASSAV